MYARPQTVEEAFALLSGASARIVCGGTDVFPAHAGRTISHPVVDLSAIGALRGIIEDTAAFRIGGATTWTSIIEANLPKAFDGLKAAAREVGSVQIQNRGTIAGNLCNASPAADGVPPLLALDASVELCSSRGMRVMPVSSFVIGYRKTALAPGEILSAIIVPKPDASAGSAFVKLGARRYLVISVVMAAAVITRDDRGAITKAAVAVGAASPVAQRLPGLERDLIGMEASRLPSSMIALKHLNSLSPITDVRATANYRLEAARIILGEALDRASGVLPGV